MPLFACRKGVDTSISLVVQSADSAQEDFVAPVAWLGSLEGRVGGPAIHSWLDDVLWDLRQGRTRRRAHDTVSYVDPKGADMYVIHDPDPAWWELFDPDTPNEAILRSVLVGRCPGLASLDRLRDPVQVLVRAQSGKAFASTGATEAFLHEALDHIGKLGWTALADTDVPESIRRCGRVVGRVRFEDCDLDADAAMQEAPLLPAH